MRLIDADGLYIPPEEMNAKMAVAYAPTVEAEPVRHGRWEPYEFGDDTWHKCSVCGTADKYINIVTRNGYIDGQPQLLSTRLVSKRNYCPICGAKMDLQ